MTASATMNCIEYSGVLSRGSAGPAVELVQRRLNELGCGPIAEDGDFGRQTSAAVQLFQARSVDMRGLALKTDGKVGPLTWAALFPSGPLPTVPFCSELAKNAVQIAAAQEAANVREDPPGSNRGVMVDRYVRSVGLEPSGQYPWCAAFVYWCFNQVNPTSNPVTKTASVMDHWRMAANNARAKRLLVADCVADPSLVRPGMIFILATGAGSGHTGLIEQVEAQYLTTIEGNTNEGGSREGIGVFRRTSRKISQINRGFIAY